MPSDGERSTVILTINHQSAQKGRVGEDIEEGRVSGLSCHPESMLAITVSPDAR